MLFPMAAVLPQGQGVVRWPRLLLRPVHRTAPSAPPRVGHPGRELLPRRHRARLLRPGLAHRRHRPTGWRPDRLFANRYATLPRLCRRPPAFAGTCPCTARLQWLSRSSSSRRQPAITVGRAVTLCLLRPSQPTFFKTIPELNKKPVVILDDAHDLAPTALTANRSMVTFDSRTAITFVHGAALSGGPTTLQGHALRRPRLIPRVRTWSVAGNPKRVTTMRRPPAAFPAADCGRSRTCLRLFLQPSTSGRLRWSPAR